MQRPSRRASKPGDLADHLTQAAADLHARTGHTAGNGALMRTSPVALAHLDDPTAVVEAAMAISALTHTDELSGQACALWSLAIRHAVLEGELDLRAGLEHLPADASGYWSERIDESEARKPGTFSPNGFVVTALQAAWSAIHHTPVPERMPCLHLQHSLDTAIRIGNDTDTVAAIAGGLLGARWGASAVPAAWRRIVHGYPGVRAERLVELAHLTVTGGRPGPNGWPLAERIDYSGWPGTDALVRHPHDDGVWLGGVDALDHLPGGVTAVVSLCLVGSQQVPKGVEHVVFRLIDREEGAENPNLDFVIDDLPGRSRGCELRGSRCCCTAWRLSRGRRRWRRGTRECSEWARRTRWPTWLLRSPPLHRGASFDSSWPDETNGFCDLWARSAVRSLHDHPSE